MKDYVQAVILNNSKTEVLLQHRDNIPVILNPNTWWLFGGSVEDGELFKDALLREMEEELEMSADHYDSVKKVHTQEREDGVVGETFEIVLKEGVEISDFTQHEGQGMAFFSFEELMISKLDFAYDIKEVAGHYINTKL